jgi:cytochrome b involved in lipid metabolism
LYTHKGLLTRLEGVAALAKWMKLPKATVVTTLEKYQKAVMVGSDEFGKTAFRGAPTENLESEVFYAGTVTPVLHYCMGGITIDTQGNVLNEEGQAIPGLHAAGEVTGGVHGENRLAGNSLLECTVYGTLVGQKIPIKSRIGTKSPKETFADATSSTYSSSQQRTVTPSELAKHNTPDDCWVAIHGIVYDLTSFAEEHPSGPESIHVLAGKDGSEAFVAVHNEGILEEVFEDVIGKLVEEDDEQHQQEERQAQPTREAENGSSREQEPQEAESALPQVPTGGAPEHGVQSSGFSSYFWRSQS